MKDRVKDELSQKVGDKKLVDNLFLSYNNITKEYLSQDAVGLLQNVGLFVESSLRIAEHFVFSKHTLLSKKFQIDKVILSLEQAAGPDGLRIHLPRLCRVAYDFRTRKKSVHLKDIDPKIIDATLVYTICTWIVIEILKESGISEPEQIIKLLFTRKIPLVQSVAGVLRTTNPKLTGTKRILLLLYAAPNSLSEDALFEGTKTKIKNRNHLKKNLKNLEKRDLVHNSGNGNWQLFGRGFLGTERIMGDANTK